MEKKELRKTTKPKAIVEINEWLKFKRIRKKVIEDNQDTIDELAELLIDGTIAIDPESKAITHTLIWEIRGPENNLVADKFVYKPRVHVNELHINYKGLSPKDTDGRILATIETFAEVSKNVLNQMDPVDYGVAQMIAVFYLPQ